MNALCLANLSIADAGPIELLDAAAAAHFDSVNMWLTPPAAMATINAKNVPTEAVIGNPRLIREITRRIAATEVGVFEASCGWLVPDFDLEGTKAVFETAAQIGTRRLSIVGWDADRARLVANLAALCREAGGYGMTIVLEFMPYSAVRTVEDTLAVLAAAGAPNLDVMVDALHLARSGATPADLRCLDPSRIGVVQLCDAPAIGPPPELLRDESVNRRRYPGEGELPLDDLLDAVPADVVIEIEAPTAAHASRTILERARLCAQHGRRFLNAYESRRLSEDPSS